MNGISPLTSPTKNRWQSTCLAASVLEYLGALLIQAYIPHISDAVRREFPRLVFLRIHLVRYADQGEDLLLEVG